MKEKKIAVLSVRVSEKNMNKWKEYLKFTGLSMPKLVEVAINEYIDNHPFGDCGVEKVIKYMVSEHKNSDVSEEPRNGYREFMENKFKEFMPELISKYKSLSH